MLVQKSTTDLLAAFVGGSMEFSTFERSLAELLFILRQNPEMTVEKEALATVQLRLHQVFEGGDKLAVYVAAKDALHILQTPHHEH